MAFAAELFLQSLFVPRRQSLGAREQRAPLRCELKRMAAAVSSGWQALDEAASLQSV